MRDEQLRQKDGAEGEEEEEKEEQNYRSLSSPFSLLQNDHEDDDDTRA